MCVNGADNVRQVAIAIPGGPKEPAPPAYTCDASHGSLQNSRQCRFFEASDCRQTRRRKTNPQTIRDGMLKTRRFMLQMGHINFLARRTV